MSSVSSAFFMRIESRKHKKSVYRQIFYFFKIIILLKCCCETFENCAMVKTLGRKNVEIISNKKVQSTRLYTDRLG